MLVKHIVRNSWLCYNTNLVFILVLIVIGIRSVLVGLLAQKAEVKFDKNKTTSDEIICHVKALGFGCDMMDQAGQGEGTVDIIVSIAVVYQLISTISNEKIVAVGDSVTHSELFAMCHTGLNQNSLEQIRGPGPYCPLLLSCAAYYYKAFERTECSTIQEVIWQIRSNWQSMYSTKTI